MSRCLVALALCGCSDTAAPVQLTPDAGEPTGRPTNQLDVLVVVDDSPSTLDKEQRLAASVAELGDMFGTFAHGFPDLHVGFVTTSVALGAHEGLSDVCATAVGYDGLMRATATGSATCETPTGAYLIDSIDVDGARYRNFAGTIHDTLACISPADEAGCTYEAPLEAMKRALDGSHPENAGFLREDAALLVVIMTDEDDASFRDTSLLDAPAAIVGADDFRAQPLYAYDCDRPIDPSADGTYNDCVVRYGSYLQDPAYYAQFLTSLKTPDQLAVLVLAGPASTTISTGPIGNPFQQSLALLPSCETRELASDPWSIARPALRLADFVGHVNATGGTATFAMSCYDSYTDILQYYGVAEAGRLMGQD